MPYLKSLHSLVVCVPAILLLCPVFLVSCAIVKGPERAPDYFLLAPVAKAPGQELPVSSGNQDEGGAVSVLVGPVEIPGYLDRPQIVKIGAENRLLLSETNRWAEPLDTAMERVIAQDISIRSRGKFSAHPFCLDTFSRGHNAGYRVTVICYGFEEHAGRLVLLNAEWTVSVPGQNKPLAEKRANFIAHVKGADMKDTISAMNNALDQLSAAILADLRSLMQ